MPYASNDDLPPSVHDRLPPHARDVFRLAFNNAWKAHHGDEAVAFRIAWAAVKRNYIKRGSTWQSRE
jgi:cation transport regulator